jgi:hypothetical protein
MHAEETSDEIVESPRTKLGQFIKREGLVASALARQAGLATPYIFELIAGRSTPRADTLDNLAYAASELLKRDVGVEEVWDFRRPPLPALGKWDRNVYRSESAPANPVAVAGDPEILRADLVRLERRFANVDLKTLKEKNPEAAERWASEVEYMAELRCALQLPRVDYSKTTWLRYRAK